jgi:hypothetical protein
MLEIIVPEKTPFGNETLIPQEQFSDIDHRFRKKKEDYKIIQKPFLGNA